MSVGIYLSIRNKASRLPGKALLPFDKKPLIVFLLERLKTIDPAAKVVVCTSDCPNDDILVRWADSCNMASFCGSQNDKLRRYLDAANKFKHDTLLIVDGDDPFISVLHARQTLEALTSPDADLVLFDNLPVGAMAFGIKTRVLRQYAQQTPEKDTEVWAPIVRQLDGLKEVTLHEPDPSKVHALARLTLDYPEDYTFCCELLTKLRQLDLPPSYENIVSLLHKNEKLVSINAHKDLEYQSHLGNSNN